MLTTTAINLVQINWRRKFVYHAVMMHMWAYVKYHALAFVHTTIVNVYDEWISWWRRLNASFQVLVKLLTIQFPQNHIEILQNQLNYTQIHTYLFIFYMNCKHHPNKHSFWCALRLMNILFWKLNSCSIHFEWSKRPINGNPIKMSHTQNSCSWASVC